jgi:hypothetical protein
MATLTSGIDDRSQIIAVTDGGSPSPADLFTVDDETVMFRSLFMEDPDLWVVTRGARGASAAHDADTELEPAGASPYLNTFHGLGVRP